MAGDKLKLEQHPLFPSGEWEGFYVYQMGGGGQKHKMSFQLEFVDGQIRGGGSDDIGSFNWSGSYDTERLYCEMTKQYIGRHAVWYQGEVDENGIWGIWLIPPFARGGFHICPKGSAIIKNTKAVVEDKLKLVIS